MTRPALSTPRRLAVRCVALAGALAAATMVVGPPSAFGQGGNEAESLSASFRKAARKVLPAVVPVRAEGGAARPVPPFAAPFRPDPLWRAPDIPPPGEAGGSGVVIDADKGFVLTNDHVVNGASRVV